MDERPIGVFDSGLGGLTTVKALRTLLPMEDIVYLGDTGRVPYGSKSRETILKYARQDAEFLVSQNIKAMVIACNTASSIAYDTLSKVYNIPIYEVVRTPAGEAVEITRNNKIGVIGTEATIRSRAYERAIKEFSSGTDVYSQACPLFVPLAEEGWTQSDNAAAKIITETYLNALRDKKIDTLILGCTHYSLLSEVIKEVIGSDVVLIDSGAETAKLVAKDLTERELLRGNDIDSSVRYYVTDSAENFTKHASRLLKSDVQGMVIQISLG